MSPERFIFTVLWMGSLPHGVRGTNMDTGGVGEIHTNRLGNNSEDNMEKVVSGEKSLMRNLLEDYDVRVRPVINSSHPVVIYHGIVPIQISELNAVEQVLTFSIWLRNEWTDPQLRWRPSDYDELTVLRVPKQSIWIPDILLYNGTSSEAIGDTSSMVDVGFNGQVYWADLRIFHVYCKVDVKYFPFDVQRCSMFIGSWMYDDRQLNTKQYSPEIDIENYMPNGEWDLVSVTAKRGELRYQRVDKYQYMEYKFTLRRRPLYYMVNIVFPCIWLSILSVMTFWLPPDSGEKISLSITVLVAFSVFMLLVAESMPKTSESVALLGIYLCVTMSLTSLTIMETIFVKKISYVGPETPRMPQWLRKLTFRYLTKLLCIHGTSIRRRLRSVADRYTDREDVVSIGSVGTCDTQSTNELGKSSETIGGRLSSHNQRDGERDDQNETKTSSGRTLLTTEEEWTIFALVLEILLSLLYTGVTVLATLGLLVVMPFTGDWYNCATTT